MALPCADIVIQTLEELSCHAAWLQCMTRCQGEWCKPCPAAQDQLQPLLSKLKLKRMLSSNQLATIKHFYTESLVRLHFCCVVHVKL